MKHFLILIMTLVVTGQAIASEPVVFKFVQSQEVKSPAASGLKRGMLFKAALPREQWPTDIMESFPQSLIAKTDLTMRYAGNHAYPAYRLWVAVGQVISAALLTGFGIVGYFAWRGRKHA